jgi:hypothetical protein
MTEGRNWGSTVLGWFLVRDEASPALDSAAPKQGDAPEAATAISAGVAPTFFQTEPPPAPGGRVDFDGVFGAAGIERQEGDRVAKAADLLGSLPSETPIAVRKQIVEASMKAFGVPLDNIIETGVEEIQALEGYIRAGAAETDRLLAESRERIQQFEDEIRNIRSVMDQRVHEQESITSACNAKKLDVQRVLEFFGQEAVARVVRESPKLHDPSASGPPERRNDGRL